MPTPRAAFYTYPDFGPWREHLPRRREVLLTVGGGLALVVGGAFSHFEPRYLVPAVPLLLAGGVLALTDLAAWAQGRAPVARQRSDEI